MRLLAVTLGVVTCAMTLSSVDAQSPPQTGSSVRDGVYTDRQAARGQVVAQNHCAHCHASDWTGLEGPPLTGDSFMRMWGPRPLRRLFEKIAETMPPGAADTLSDADRLDVLAFVLQTNGLPSGAHDLSRDAPVLSGTAPIALTSRLAVGSFVQASGCLRSAGQEWVLTESTGPAFVTPTANDAGPGSMTTPGSASVRLMNVFPVPTDKVDRTVFVQGLLVANGPSFVINVVSLTLAGREC